MKFEWEGKEYFIHETLSAQLNSLVYNLKSDWDFVILITGDRKVRVGKSVLAMTICAYLARGLAKLKSDRKVLNKNAYSIDNIYFDNKKMIDGAQNKSKYSVIQYDEAREGLAASKAMKQFQQDLIDFFNECGQLNHIFVVVCPDFFELKEDIAVGRSEFLINVYRKESAKMMDIYNEGKKIPITVLSRGYFEFFSRNAKQNLYDIARSTRRKSYHHVRADFIGNFTNQYTVNEEEYRRKKQESLARFKERHNEEKLTKDIMFRNKYIMIRHKEGYKHQQIADDLMETFGVKLARNTISEIIQKNKPNGLDVEEYRSLGHLSKLNIIEKNKKEDISI